MVLAHLSPIRQQTAQRFDSMFPAEPVVLSWLLICITRDAILNAWENTAGILIPNLHHSVNSQHPWRVHLCLIWQRTLTTILSINLGIPFWTHENTEGMHAITSVLYRTTRWHQGHSWGETKYSVKGNIVPSDNLSKSYALSWLNFMLGAI